MKSKKYLLAFFAILLAAIIIVPTASAENVNVTPFTTPFITIDPIGNHTTGDIFFINGTTNLPVTENLMMDVYPFRSVMEQKGYKTSGIFVVKIPIISRGNEVNHWSVNVTDGYWEPDEYIADIAATELVPQVSVYQLFTMVPDKTTINRNYTSPQSTRAVSTSLPSIQNTLDTPTLKVTPLPVILSIFAIFAGIIFLNSFNYRKRE